MWRVAAWQARTVSAHHMVMIKDIPGTLAGCRLVIKSIVLSLNNPLQVLLPCSCVNQSSSVYNTVNVRVDSAKLAPRATRRDLRVVACSA